MPPKKEDLYLTKEQTMRLCELYQEETDLWNTSSTNYHKKDTRTNALERIREKLMEEFENLQPTGDQIWTKLLNLRCYYSRELKKATSSQKSGAGTDDLYQSSWSYFEVLDSFLRSHIVPRKSTTNMDISFIDDDEAEDSETSSHASEEGKPLNKEAGTPVRFLNKKRKLSGPDAVMAEAINVLSDIRSKTAAHTQEEKKEGDADIFARHVANKLGGIRDQRALGLVKIKIQTALFEAQNGIGIYQGFNHVLLSSHSQNWQQTSFDGRGQNGNYASNSTASFMNLSDKYNLYCVPFDHTEHDKCKNTLATLSLKKVYATVVYLYNISV